jgi:DNA-binding NarL/FixJ family response regulator
MSSYLLLRNQVESGPFSFEELKKADLKSTDLIWIVGKSSVWNYADEIKKLRDIVHYASAVTNYSPDGLKAGLQTRAADNSEEKSVKEDKAETGNTKLPGEDINTDVVKSFDSKEKYLVVNPLPATKIIKVVIADDHGLFRQGVKMALAHKKDIVIAGEAENGLQLLHLLKHNIPDIILLDIQMPIMDGISTLSAIRKTYNDIKVIMLSMYNDHSMVSTLMEAGANAYLTKTADSETIYEAIKTCYEKSHYFNDLTNISLLEKIRSKKPPENSNKIKPESQSFLSGKPILTRKQNSVILKKPVKQLIVVTCSILIITSGILTGITILSHSGQTPLISQQKFETRAGETLLQVPHTQEAPIPNSDVVATRQKISDNSLPHYSGNQPNEMADSEIFKTDQVRFKNKARKLTIPLNIYSNIKYAGSKQTSASGGDFRKQMTLKKLHSLVTVHVNDLSSAGVGIPSGVGFTLYNQTFYTLDLVKVDVKYLLQDSVVYKKEILNFTGVAPLSSSMILIPMITGGARIDFRIVSVKSKELNL